MFKKITTFIIIAFSLFITTDALASELICENNENSFDNIKTLNEDELKFSNVDEWHEKGFTGKGVKIVISEGSKVFEDSKLFEGKVSAIDKFHSSSKEITGSHAEMTTQVIREVAPDAEIYVSIENVNTTLKTAMKLDAQIVNRSMTYRDNQLTNDIENTRKAYYQGIFLNGSSGNNGSEKISAYARSPYWWTTGAVDLKKENKIIRPSYSSYGQGLNSVSFTSLLVCDTEKCEKENRSHYTGTSASAPFLSGMVALYYQYYKQQNGVFPNVGQVKKFITENSLDLEEKGFDFYTGNGLFVLPKLN